MRIYQGGYQKGRWKACCDRCGGDFRSHQLRQEWTGLRVCHGPGTNDCWETRHPQDFLRGKRDDQSPEWVRPAPPERWIFEPILDEDGDPILDAVSDSVIDASDNTITPDDL